MDIHHINAILAAIIYAVAAVFSKQALSRGAGILRLSFAVNLVFLPLFAILLAQHETSIDWGQVHQPIITGALFFTAQIFTFSAIRVGDVSLQTPMMGTKAVFAVIIAVVLGTEVVGLPMFAAAFVAMLGVGFLGFSGNGADRVGISITLALLSSLFFAGSDTMVGFYAGSFGVPAFLFLTFLTNTVLSFGLIPFFKEPLRATPRKAWPWILAACLLMGVQALLLNYTLGRYQHVAEVNVLYSTRGLWSVIFGALAVRMFDGASQTGQRRVYILRFAGALLMCLAIAILFYSEI